MNNKDAHHALDDLNQITDIRNQIENSKLADAGLTEYGAYYFSLSEN